MSNSNSYFCVLPFFGSEITTNSQTTPCCLLPKKHDIAKIQNQMLNQQRPEECIKCWDLENQGVVSDRQLKNSAFDFYADKSIENIEQDCKLGNYSTKIVKLYTSNLCNSTCVTCGPQASTKWQSLKNFHIQKNHIDNNKLQSIDWENIKMLSFVGGEPLLEKQNLSIIEQLADKNNTCFVSFVTNGSITLTENQKRTFAKLKNLNICLSIDGIEKQFEYIRYPLKWTTLLDNINQYKEICSNLSVSFTISNLNILYYNQIVNWFTEQKLPYNHIIVTSPAEFNIEVMPVDVKNNLPLVKNKSNFDKHLFNRFINTIKEQDKLKNISIDDYLPELSKIIKQYSPSLI